MQKIVYFVEENKSTEVALITTNDNMKNVIENYFKVTYDTEPIFSNRPKLAIKNNIIYMDGYYIFKNRYVYKKTTKITPGYVWGYYYEYLLDKIGYFVIIDQKAFTYVSPTDGIEYALDKNCKVVPIDQILFVDAEYETDKLKNYVIDIGNLYNEIKSKDNRSSIKLYEYYVLLNKCIVERSPFVKDAHGKMLVDKYYDFINTNIIKIDLNILVKTTNEWLNIYWNEIEKLQLFTDLEPSFRL